MKKAIILTYAPITEAEKLLLINTEIFKLAINQHCSELKPNCRIIADYWNWQFMINNFPETLIVARESIKHPRVISKPDLPCLMGTITSAIVHLLEENTEKILLVADNKVHGKVFQDEIKKAVSELNAKNNIYQYSQGNFDLPVIKIKEFIKWKQHI